MDFENIETKAGVENLQEIITPIDSDCVEFIIREEDKGKYKLPTPAHKHIPEWYKNTDLYVENDSFDKTVRGCMPFMEALTFGWIVRAPVDIAFETSDEGLEVTWNDKSFDPIGSHPLQQVGGDLFPHKTSSILKFNMPYVVRTPKGVSTLYMPLLNRFNRIMTPFSGVVDTDTYMDEINIPAIFWDTSFEGMVEAGTPIAQMIPFERDSLIGKSIKRTMTEEEEELLYLTKENVAAVNAYYKENVWTPKKASKEIPETHGCPFHKE